MRNCASFSKSTSKNPIKYEQPTQKFVKWGFSSLLCSRIEIESVHSPQYIYAIAHQFPKDVALFGDCTHYRLTYQKFHFFTVFEDQGKGSWYRHTGWEMRITFKRKNTFSMYVFIWHTVFEYDAAFTEIYSIYKSTFWIQINVFRTLFDLPTHDERPSYVRLYRDIAKALFFHSRRNRTSKKRWRDKLKSGRLLDVRTVSRRCSTSSQ